MGAIYVQDDDTVDYTPVADTAAGAVIVQNDLIGVALRPIPANTLGSLAVEGIFDFPKSTAGGSAIGAGATVYWNAAAQQATTTSAGNKLIGKTTKAAADADTTVRVRLQQ
jgi:predicted RecA/RadA family phage recombinase